MVLLRSFESMAKQVRPTTTTTGRDTSTLSAIAASVFAFEGDWEPDLRNRWSIEPMLRTIEDIGELKFIHRRVATIPELEHYISKWLRNATPTIKSVTSDFTAIQENSGSTADAVFP